MLQEYNAPLFTIVTALTAVTVAGRPQPTWMAKVENEIKQIDPNLNFVLLQATATVTDDRKALRSWFARAMAYINNGRHCYITEQFPSLQHNVRVSLSQIRIRRPLQILDDVEVTL